jgi:hypothetical protein
MRPDNWPALLEAYIATARKRSFVWGSHDCVSVTCGWQALVTGVHSFAPFAGKYDSEKSAFRVMHEHDVHSMEDAGDFLFGRAARKSVDHIQRGDIVLAENALGICVGVRAACLKTDGMKFLLFNKFQVAWSI